MRRGGQTKRDRLMVRGLMCVGNLSAAFDRTKQSSGVGEAGQAQSAAILYRTQFDAAPPVLEADVGPTAEF